MKFIDFFAGMGTARMAFEQAKHECVYSVEWDKHKRRIYNVIFGAEPAGADIREIRGYDLPRADCWLAGFPCQDISIAGNQSGFNGTRSSLFFEVVRLLQEVKEEDKPRWLLFENVKNFFSVNSGRDFLTALVEMDACGYDSEWQLLNSKHFGVPQNRERVFIIGHLRNRCTRKVFPVTKDSRLFAITNTTNEGQLQTEICATTCRQRQDRADCTYIEVRAVLTPDRTEKRQNGRRFKDDGEPMFTLTGQDRHGVALRQLIAGRDAERVYDSKGIARTLKAEGGGQGAKTGLYQVAESRIRRLTPRECFRLQAVPEHIIDRILSSGISDTQCYRAAGDAMTVSVVYQIAKQMEE
jgi:DNA (cytosine-5)-methyltransferase 1